MPQVYNLDLETMLATLSRRQLSGNLVADIARGKVGREPAHLEISVDSGKIVSCLLQSGQTYVTGENVLQLLARLEIIPWVFVASSPQQSVGPATKSLVPPGEVSQPRVPRRLATLQQGELARLPRTHFQVYAYLDGRKTIEEIAQLLRTTPEQIERVLLDLQTWKIVQYR